MAVHYTERNRASRIRKKVREGRATEDERQWLESYASRTSSTTTSAPAPAFAPAPAPSPSPTPARPSMVAIDFSAPTDSDKGASPAPAKDKPIGPTCTIPDCPACKTQRGGAICATTGKRVWPPMSEAGAEAMAGVILAGFGFVLQFFRDDRRIIPPTAAERKALGAALRESALRRASWVGAFDDLFALFGALGGYTMRAMREPSLKPALPKPPEPPPQGPPPVDDAPRNDAPPAPTPDMTGLVSS